MVVASFSHATDIKDQVVGKRLSPPAFDTPNYIKKRRVRGDAAEGSVLIYYRLKGL